MGLVLGVVFCLTGLIWIGQGVGLIGHSMMSGHGRYAVLGALVLTAGLLMIASHLRSRRRRG